jgi:hypothetical protein
MYETDFWQGNPWTRSAVAALTPELLGQWQDWLGLPAPAFAALQ